VYGARAIARLCSLPRLLLERRGGGPAKETRKGIGEEEKKKKRRRIEGPFSSKEISRKGGSHPVRGEEERRGKEVGMASC